MSFSNGTTEALITFILGGGLIALITQGIRASRMWRAGKIATTREVIRDIAAARDEAEDREEEQRADAVYWASRAADYMFQLRQVGITPNPPTPEPPSAVRRRKDRAVRKSTRNKRAELAPTTEEIERVIGTGEEDSVR